MTYVYYTHYQLVVNMYYFLHFGTEIGNPV